jgi:hypothetical protein
MHGKKMVQLHKGKENYGKLMHQVHTKHARCNKKKKQDDVMLDTILKPQRSHSRSNDEGGDFSWNRKTAFALGLCAFVICARVLGGHQVDCRPTPREESSLFFPVSDVDDKFMRFIKITPPKKTTDGGIIPLNIWEARPLTWADSGYTCWRDGQKIKREGNNSQYCDSYDKVGFTFVTSFWSFVGTKPGTGADLKHRLDKFRYLSDTSNDALGDTLTHACKTGPRKLVQMFAEGLTESGNPLEKKDLARCLELSKDNYWHPEVGEYVQGELNKLQEPAKGDL